MMLGVCRVEYGRNGGDGMKAFLQIVNIASSLPTDIRHPQVDHVIEVE
jgi:hypothetical protein